MVVPAIAGELMRCCCYYLLVLLLTTGGCLLKKMATACCCHLSPSPGVMFDIKEDCCISTIKRLMLIIHDVFLH